MSLACIFPVAYMRQIGAPLVTVPHKCIRQYHGNGPKSNGSRNTRTNRFEDEQECDYSKIPPTRKRTKRSGHVLGFDLKASNVEFIYGLSAVEAALKQGNREHYGLIAKRSNGGDVTKSRLGDITQLVTEMDLSVKWVQGQEITEIVGVSNHQGVALKTSKLVANRIKDLGPFVDGEHEITQTGGAVVKYGSRRSVPLWLCLDGIQDTHNLGSILRTALYFGVDGVLLDGDEYCRPSAVVSKISCGAMECLPIFKVNATRRFFNKAKANGWKVLCTTTHSTAVAESVMVDDLPEQTQPTILVMGGESNGISQGILDLSDLNVHIEERSDVPSFIDSLNVGVAAGVILSKINIPKKPRD
ncbi:hypothetical protein GGI07_000689 [Coemansia sp. Benny D115]|nr:hypothetical protein GGI07_000689 [Coemansia sp. Benny D115]